MGQQVSSAKPPRKGTSTKRDCLSPSCRELAQQFVELQILRQKVRAAECGQSPSDRKLASRG
jgi:hypothetical protein